MSDTPGSTPGTSGAGVARTVLAAALVGIALLGATVVWLAAYGIAREYGVDAAGGYLAFAAFAVIPAAVAAAAVALARRGLRAALLGGFAAWAVVVLVAAGLTTLADRQHDADAAAREAACSSQDRELLAAVPGYSADLGGPTGGDDGSCSVTLGGRGGAEAAVGAVVDGLTAAGWAADPALDDGSIRLTRDGAVLLVSAGAADDKGWTDVIVATGP